MYNRILVHTADLKEIIVFSHKEGRKVPFPERGHLKSIDLIKKKKIFGKIYTIKFPAGGQDKQTNN